MTSDICLLVMPCCHVNSLYMSFAVTWLGGTVMCYNMISFDPEDLLKVFSEHGVTFTSSSSHALHYAAQSAGGGEEQI